MPRKKTLPGSIYVQKGRSKLIIKHKGRVIHTGLEDTKEGRKLAAQILERLYLEEKGLAPVLDTSAPRIDEAFDTFLQTHCLNKAPKTVQNYVLAFKNIVRANYPLNLKDVEADVLHYIKTGAVEKKHSDISINTNLRQFQVFLNFCAEREWLPETKFKSKFAKKVHYTVKVFSKEEIETIVGHFRAHDPEFATMIEFMSLTGARVVDALTLRWEHVSTNSVMFFNKITKKPEVVPVLPRAIEVLEMLERKTEGKVFRWQYAGQSYIHKVLRETLQKLNIDQQGRSFQEFRTSYRNWLLDAGVAPEVAMKLMRHGDIRTTLQHYTKISDEMLEKGLAKLEQ